MTQLEDNEAAIIFSPEGVRLAIPDGDDNDTVPEYILAATYIYILMTSRGDKLQPFIDEIQEEVENIENES